MLPHNKQESFDDVEIIEISDVSQGGEAAETPSLIKSRNMHPPYANSFSSPPACFNIKTAGEIRPASSLWIARKPGATISQQFRWLKYKLKIGNDPRLIGITSPFPREGKSTVAANLGLALAEGRRLRVLLLDMNFRAPALNQLFGLSTGNGIAEQLQRKHFNSDERWEILELGSRLHLLAGGAAVENPASLLNSTEIMQLFSDLADYYDYIIVDLPAVLLAADAKIIQEQMDAVILVCRAGKTTRDALQKAIAQLGSFKVQGIVMLDIKKRYFIK